MIPRIMLTILNIAWEQTDITSARGFAASPILIIAKPRNRENTMIGIMSPFVRDANGLLGRRSRIVW